MYHEYHYVPITISNEHMTNHYYNQSPLSQTPPQRKMSDQPFTPLNQHEGAWQEDASLNLERPRPGYYHHHHYHPRPGYYHGYGHNIAPFLIGGVTGAVIAGHNNQPTYMYPPGYNPYTQPTYYPYGTQGYPTPYYQ